MQHACCVRLCAYLNKNGAMNYNKVTLGVEITVVCASQMSYNSAALEQFNFVFKRVNLERNMQASTGYF